MKKCLPLGWSFVHNLVSGPVARIIVAWDCQQTQHSVVTVLFTFEQMLLLSVVMHQKAFVVSFIYGFNQASDRRKLWDELRMGLDLVGNQPWIILGDFNAVRWQQDRFDPTSFDSATGV